MNGIDYINAERRRQFEEEGYTLDHDRDYVNEELLQAALSYETPKEERWMVEAKILEQKGIELLPAERKLLVPNTWPWHPRFWKPSNRTRDLAKAGALVMAERDRIIHAYQHFPELGYRRRVLESRIENIALRIDALLRAEFKMALPPCPK